MENGLKLPERVENDPPIYKLVVKALRSEIVSGIYPVGTKLPSEAALRDRFGISRHTVREALRALRDEGLVESRQGLGTIVLMPGSSQIYVHQVSSISDLFDVNVETRYSPVTGALVALPPGRAQQVGVGEDRTWLRIHGLRYKPLEDEPMCELEAFVASRFAGVGRVMGRHKGSIYGLIEMIYGENVSEVRQDVSAFKAAKGESTAIGLNEGDVGIEIRRVFRIAPEGEIAIVSFNRYPADRDSFSMTLRRQLT